MLALTLIFPLPVLIYLLMSVATFLLYLIDKRKASRARWRIPESTLLLAELVGGWPGAFLGQHFLRHKNRKVEYQVIFWLIVMVHLLFWAWYFRVIRF